MHVLAAPNGMPPLPLTTVPFWATSSARLLVALKKRTVVLAFGVPTGLSLSPHAASAAVAASTSTEAVKRDCTGPPELTDRAHSRPCFAVPLRTYRTPSANLNRSHEPPGLPRMQSTPEGAARLCRFPDGLVRSETWRSDEDDCCNVRRHGAGRTCDPSADARPAPVPDR